MKELWNNFVMDESGQGLVEYVMLIVLIALGMIAALILFQEELAGIYNAVTSKMEAELPGS